METKNPSRGGNFCDPGGIQTHDLQNRNLTLYSAKLRSHLFLSAAKIVFLADSSKSLLRLFSRVRKSSVVRWQKRELCKFEQQGLVAHSVEMHLDAGIVVVTLKFGDCASAEAFVCDA